MGCIVNGPGESSMPISASRCPARAKPAAPVFIDGKKALTLRGPNLADDFKGCRDD
jgi:(E)-4-hydroxy-3-methylbut-2-enyl-diphosphate synthase